MTPQTISSLADIAQLAGVSVSTVSRALAGNSLVNVETRRRVCEIAQAHGFRPNELARNLRLKRTKTIGVAVPLGHEIGQHLTDPFFLTLIGHLASRLTELGYDLLLSRVIPADGAWLDQLTGSGRLEGLLLIGQSNQLDAIERAAERYLPLVAWGAVLPGMRHCAIGTDNQRGARIATEHLIGLGRRRIAFFGHPGAPEIAQRYAGVREACAAAGLPPPELLPAHLTPDAAHDMAALRFAGPAPLPDGVVAASDVVAMSAVRAATERGMLVPDDIAITGFDDVSFAAQTSPPLTTVRQDLEHAGDLMVDHLFRRMKGERTASVMLPPALVIRGSAPAA